MGYDVLPSPNLELEGLHSLLGSLRSSSEALRSGGQSGTHGGHLGRPRRPEIVRSPRHFTGPP